MKHEFTVKVKDIEQKLKMIKINPEIRLESQKWYSRAFNEAISNGFMLRLELEKILEDKNLLDSEAEEKKISESRKRIKDLEIELRQGVKNSRKMTKEEGRLLAVDIRKERQKLRDIGSALNNLVTNTAENYASNEQMQFFIFACTVHEGDGQRYWNSYEIFKTDTDGPVYAEAAKEFLSMMTGIDKDSERKLYENQWLIRMGYMSPDLQLIDTKGRLVDNDGRLINTDGRYINENGNYVDIYGNPVDEEGNLLLKDSWGVLETAPTVKETKVEAVAVTV